jgi:ankyrin repeat protein
VARPRRGGARASLSERRKAQLLRLSTAAQEKGDAQTAFFLALRGDHLRVARRLVDSGEVDVNTPDAKSGRTALHDAVQKGELVKAEFLCRFGADLYALDNHFNNPTKVENIDTRTHAVCARNAHAHTLTSVNHFNNPTQMAMDAGNVEMVHLLQQWGGVGVPDAHRHKSRR